MAEIYGGSWCIVRGVGWEVTCSMVDGGGGAGDGRGRVMGGMLDGSGGVVGTGLH